jgi:membrane protein DedA with SNARE-associated domain
LLDKWGLILKIKKRDLKKAEDWFIRHGNSTVFLCRFIPIVRSLISIPAGMARMKIGKFLFYTILGTAIWNTVLIYLGALAGENWKSILTYLNTYSYIAGLILAVLGICFVVWFIRKRKARKSTEESSEK